jgi:hypothetical protein
MLFRREAMVYLPARVEGPAVYRASSNDRLLPFRIRLLGLVLDAHALPQ